MYLLFDSRIFRSLAVKSYCRAFSILVLGKWHISWICQTAEGMWRCNRKHKCLLSVPFYEHVILFTFMSCICHNLKIFKRQMFFHILQEWGSASWYRSGGRWYPPIWCIRNPPHAAHYKLVWAVRWTLRLLSSSWMSHLGLSWSNYYVPRRHRDSLCISSGAPYILPEVPRIFAVQFFFCPSHSLS